MLKATMLKFRHLLMGAMFAVTLLACSVPSMQQSSNPTTTSESKPAVPTYTTTSYVLAEPLPNKKLKISITAKDQDLYITNCNAYIGINLFDKANPQNNWGEVTNSCRSQDLIIPQGSTLTFERQITESHFPINLNGTYRVGTALSYNPNLKNSEIAENLRLSNPVKLIP